MSSLPIPRPKRISDGQFIGDLTSLLERRGLVCGDPASLDGFAAALADNNALRGDLFGLCTAISHLSAEDLSGEELLTLVARALGGNGILRDDGSAEVPAGMRSAFLEGWEAWNKRGSLMEDSVWPPPRKPVQRAEYEPAGESERSGLGEDGAGEASADAAGASEAGTGEVSADAAPRASRPRMPGMPTVQEALELARVRVKAVGSDPIGFPGGMPGSAGANGANIEGLTLGELKKLLEEIEDRVRRIEPQMQQMISAERPVTNESRQGEWVPAADRSGGHAEPVRTGRGAVIAFESAMRTELPQGGVGGFDETKFLARHAYLRPKGAADRGVGGAEVTGGLAGGPAEAGPMGVMAAVSAADLPGVVAPGIVTASAPSAASETPAPAATATAVAATAPTAPADANLFASSPVAVAPAQTGELRLSAVVAQRRPAPFAEPEWPVGVLIGNVRVSLKTIAGGIAMMVLLAGGLAGTVLYSYMHPRYIYFDSESKPVGAGAGSAADASGPQVILTAPESSLINAAATQGLHSGLMRGGAKQKGTAVQPPPPVAVWPATSQQTGQDGAGSATSLDSAADAAAQAAADAATRRAGLASLAAAERSEAESGPVHVASTTMIGYALASPKPAYPANEAKGITGTVVVAISISKHGNVTNARAVSGPVELRKAAVDAVQEWRFKPYLVAGSPADVTTTLGFFFNGQ